MLRMPAAVRMAASYLLTSVQGVITDQHVKGSFSDIEYLCCVDVSTAKLLMKAMLAVAAYPAMDVASASYGFWSKLHHTLISATAAAMVGSAAILILKSEE